MTLWEDSAVHDLYHALWQSAFVLLYYVMQHAENCKKKKQKYSVDISNYQIARSRGRNLQFEHSFMHANQTVPEKYNFISPAPPP